MKKLLATLALLCLSLCPVKAATVTLPAVADSYVQYGTPTTNYGSANVIDVESNGATDPLTRWGYLKFDLSSLVGATITSVSLNLYGNSTNTTSDTIRCYTTATTWTETGLTWNSKTPISTTNYNDTIVGTTAQYWNWNVGGLCPTLVSPSNSSVGFLLKTTAYGANHLPDVFNSKEATTSPPKLTVTYTGPPLTVSGGDTQIYLSWPAIPGASGYKIYRGNSSGTETAIAATTNLTFTDTGLTNSTGYYYTYQAYNVAGNVGPMSQEQGETPEAGRQLAFSWNFAPHTTNGPFVQYLSDGVYETGSDLCEGYVDNPPPAQSGGWSYPHYEISLVNPAGGTLTTVPGGIATEEITGTYTFRYIWAGGGPIPHEVWMEVTSIVGMGFDTDDPSPAVNTLSADNGLGISKPVDTVTEIDGIAGKYEYQEASVNDPTFVRVEVNQITGEADFIATITASGEAESSAKPVSMYCNDYMYAYPVTVGHWVKATDGLGPSLVTLFNPTQDFAGPNYSSGETSNTFNGFAPNNLEMIFQGTPVGSYLWIDDQYPYGAIPDPGPYQLQKTSIVTSSVGTPGILDWSDLNTGNGDQYYTVNGAGGSVSWSSIDTIPPSYSSDFDSYSLSNLPYTQTGDIMLCPCESTGIATVTLQQILDLLTPWE
jgi:hypothetical protein